MWSRASRWVCCILLGLVGLGCAGSDEGTKVASDLNQGPAVDAGSEVKGGEEGSLVAVGASTYVGRELPLHWLAELRLEGADADGRLLTLAAGFIATAECSDCGAPRYATFLAVRCPSEDRCELLTANCELSLAKSEGERVLVSMTAVEGSEAPERCEGYSGTFEATPAPE